MSHLREVEAWQLSFDLGLPKSARPPSGSSFRFSGELASAAKQLAYRERVTIVLSNADGEVISSSVGWVKQIAFRRHRGQNGLPGWTERKHTIAIEHPDGEDDVDA